MSDRMRYRYFLAAGKSLEAIRTIVAARVAAHKARHDLADAFGADGTFGSDSSLVGLCKNLPKSHKGGFVARGDRAKQAAQLAPPPSGFKARIAGPGEGNAIIWEPDKKTKEGKALAARFDDESLRMPDHRDFERAIGGGSVLQLSKLHYVLFFHIGQDQPDDNSEWIIRLPTATIPAQSEFGKSADGSEPIIIKGFNKEQAARGQVVPPDAIPLKTSEYWQRIEAWESRTGRFFEDAP